LYSEQIVTVLRVCSYKVTMKSALLSVHTVQLVISKT